MTKGDKGDLPKAGKWVPLTLMIVAVAALAAISTVAPQDAPGDVSVLDSGDIAFVSFCAALVMLMTPALGFFYAGLVGRHNVLSVLAQSVAIFALVSIIWAAVGYSIAFGPDISGLSGGLSHLGLAGVGQAPDPAYASTIPSILFFFFQLKFAAITPALIIGAFAERMKFSTLLVFVTLWSLLIYAPVAHWVWGNGGWLREAGTLDFAGGTVVHILAGFSALAAALVVGRRKNGKNSKPNNIPFVYLGAALLWFGWFGFNGGSALAANGVAINAMVVTNMAAAAAALAWMFTDWSVKGKPSASGIAMGAVCGLVAITPASGFVGVPASIAIGIAAGIGCNLIAGWRAERTRLDDTLDVFACHGMGGVIGAIATGIFASLAINPAGANGLLLGNASQLGVQVVSVVASAGMAFVGSYVLLKILGRLMGLRVSDDVEASGLDMGVHGEEAYG